MILIRTLENLRQVYPKASDDNIQYYINLRDEGHDKYYSEVRSGLRASDDEY